MDNSRNASSDDESESTAIIDEAGETSHFQVRKYVIDVHKIVQFAPRFAQYRFKVGY